jgi:hypothetical protein
MLRCLTTSKFHFVEYICQIVFKINIYIIISALKNFYKVVITHILRIDMLQNSKVCHVMISMSAKVWVWMMFLHCLSFMVLQSSWQLYSYY